MTKSPFYNALVAIVYIIFIVLLMNFVAETEVNTGIAQYLMPIMVISLFTLSAAVMGYIFLFQPIRLYLDKKRDEAIKLFIKTTAIFAVIVLIIIVISFILYII